MKQSLGFPVGGAVDELFCSWYFTWLVSKREGKPISGKLLDILTEYVELKEILEEVIDSYWFPKIFMRSVYTEVSPCLKAGNIRVKMSSLLPVTGYLGDILEDLGHPLTESLKAIVFLLKLSPKDFFASSSGQPQKLVSAVKEMRSIATQPSSRKN